MGLHKSRNFAAVLLIAGGIVILLLFLAFGPPKLLAKSDQPAFCVQCHVMEAQYEAWSHAGAHRRKMCVDCHLPNDNATIHYIWKAIDGMKDVVIFYSGTVPNTSTHLARRKRSFRRIASGVTSRR
jgi:cytochrome c nitrite reductase small subunit